MKFPQVRLMPILLLIIIGVLQYRLWFETGGIKDMMHLKKQLQVEQERNEHLKQRNNLLSQQIENLQKNKAAMESRARQDLGMVKKGETFYKVVKSNH